VLGGILNTGMVAARSADTTFPEYLSQAHKKARLLANISRYCTAFRAAMRRFVLKPLRDRR